MAETMESPASRKAQKELQRQEKEKERAEKKLKKEQARAEKEALKHERELMREQAEAEKEEKRREREAKRQQEEAEKERKRQEKEALEKKKNAAIERQAGILGRFLKRDQTTPPKQTEAPEETLPSSQNWALIMDNELAQSSSIDLHEIWRKLTSSWKSRRKGGELLYWGSRRTPKAQLFKELRVRDESKTAPQDASVSASSSKKPRKKLLQFHKCYRPPYYGTFSQKSNVIGPRHPLRKEPTLNYEIDSDDEWEEETSGESISGCDDDEEEVRQDADIENDDGFVVPDGYLSENEGVDVDRVPMSTGELPTSSSQDPLNVLRSVTERALKSNRPYIIQSFRTSPTDLDGDAAVLRDLFLQALSGQILTDDLIVEPPVPEEHNQETEAPKSGTKRGRKSGPSLTDADVPEIVCILQSTSQGMKKTVELLSEKHPDVPKSRIELKIREVADYKDNEWKVKDEVLAMFQPQKKIAVSEIDSDVPGVVCKPVSNYFLKRCLPVEDKDGVVDIPVQQRRQTVHL